jgi:enoyl-CoA hydratase
VENLLSYELADGVAAVTMDDGKVNVMSRAMQSALHGAFDRAERDGAAVLLSGRPGLFSAGFDLAVLRAGGPDAVAMVRGGFELAYRVLSFPRPVVVACTGHAMAMGVFLMLSGDYRVGAAGPYRFAANEVAIGLVIPEAALAVLRHRLTPAAVDRAAILAETFTPDNAVGAGLLDQVVPATELAGTARTIATALSTLDAEAHAVSKLRARAATLATLRAAIDGPELLPPALPQPTAPQPTAP